MRTNYKMLIEIKDWFPKNMMFISGEEVEYIRKHFCIEERDNTDLQNLRDFVVMYYSLEQNRNAVNMDKMSAIVYVIDDEKFDRGLEV